MYSDRLPRSTGRDGTPGHTQRSQAVRTGEIDPGKICDDSSFTKKNDAVREIERFVEIVGYQQNCGPHPVQKAAEHVLHFGPRERIERAKWLVHEQDFRFGSQRASQSDALPLPARKLMRKALGKRRWIEADQLQQFVASSNSFLSRLSFRFKNDADVALNIEVRKQAGLLNDVAHFSAQLNETEIADGRASYIDLAARRLDHPICRTEERGFPGAAAAENRSDSALFKCERYVVEQQTAARYLNGNISKFQCCAHHNDLLGSLPRRVCSYCFVTSVSLSSASRSISLFSGSIPARAGILSTTISNVCLPSCTHCF